MASQILASTVVRKNHMDYPAGRSMSIPCEGSKVIGEFWWTPENNGCGSLDIRYSVTIKEGNTPPEVDSLKVLKIKNADDTFLVAVANNGSGANFTDLCNDCCGENATMAAITIPAIVSEEQGCPDEDGNYHYISITQALAAGQVYGAEAVINGTRLTPIPGGGFATLALFKTWANTNWAPHSVDYTGTKVTLTSATGKTGFLSVYTRPA